MAGYLLESNHLGLAVTRTSNVRQQIEEARKAGERFGTCVPALCEIETGIQKVRYPDAYRRNLKRLQRHARIWPLDLETMRIYGEIYQDLRSKDRALSQVDMMLAAPVRQMRLTLLTTDREFEALPKIRTADRTAAKPEPGEVPRRRPAAADPQQPPPRAAVQRLAAPHRAAGSAEAGGPSAGVRRRANDLNNLTYLLKTPLVHR